jgi:hypothetical protein
MGSRRGRHRWSASRTLTTTCRRGAPPETGGGQDQDIFRRGETGGTDMVLNLMLIGLAVTLDPLPLSAFLVVLPSKRGVRKGAAFVFGWLVSLAIVVTATVLATGNNPPKPNTAPSLASLAVRIALGAGLVAIAIRDRRRSLVVGLWLIADGIYLIVT